MSKSSLDRLVRERWDVSWGKARAWIASGKVTVQGRVVLEPTAHVEEAAKVELALAAPGPRTGTLRDEEVIHADSQIVVVAKAAGISTVPFVGHGEHGEHAGRGDRADRGEPQGGDTLDARVRGWLERRRLVPRGARPSLGVVHRLDKETTGLVVFTRTWAAKQSLAGQFRRHTVHRRYLAIAHGDVRARTFRTMLLADRGDGLRGSARGHAGAQGREAITHVEPVEGLRGATLVACRLETGRTHQIRIHLSEAGHPLLGEPVYVRDYAGPLLEAPRLMLHAAELGFVHPSSDQELRWELPLPEDMAGVLAGLRRV
jgi:23S rRNA pseudouridine1911/1915/1917 synthase